MTKKPSPIISYILALVVTILIASYAISFFVQKSAVCDKDHVQLCATENICSTDGLYWWDNACHLIEQPKPAPSEYPDYDALQGMKSLPLVENFVSYTPKSQVLEKYSKKGIILNSGKISRGYLEVTASINDKPLTSWESMYFKAPYDVVNHYEYGGHLFRPDSLKVPPSDITHLLYSLNNIPFLPNFPYSESAKPNTFDLFEIINDKKEVKFYTFISSLNPAKINLIKIYYECDGEVNAGNCSLTLEK